MHKISHKEINSMNSYSKKLDNIKWFATTITGIESLANESLGLTLSDFKILFYLLSKIDSHNCAKVPNQKEISKELNISIRKISESFKRLKIAKIIVKTDSAKTYLINPNYFYTGGIQYLDEKKELFNIISYKSNN